MFDVIVLILPFFGLIFLGYLAAKLVEQPDGAMGWLNIFIIYIALPALFYKLLSNTPIEQFKSVTFLFTTTYVAFIIFILNFAISHLVERSSLGDSTVKGLAGAYGNLGYMGPGIALLAFGEDAAVPVALIFCIENIMHFTIAPVMMSFAQDKRQSMLELTTTIFKNVAFHPFIIATILGIGAAFFAIKLPSAAMEIIDILAGAAAPCALFAMGVTLALRPLNRVPGAIYYIVPFKLLVFPFLTLLFLSLMGQFDPLWVKVAVMLASLPTATNVFVIGQQYGFWAQRASATIFFSTILSVITISLWLWGFQTGLIPTDLFP